MSIEKWLKNHTHSLVGKRVAITGSTGGLGLVLSAHLVRLGAGLILLDRNEKRSAANRERLLSLVPNAEVSLLPVDLSDMKQVRAVTKTLCDAPPDVFIHNAGAYSIPRHTCDTGYDNVYQINFVSPYYMIRTLLPVMQTRGGHVMVVGSIAHRYGRIDAEDVDFHTRRAASKVYGNAKRYLMFALYALFRNETAVTLAVSHPGITPTGITAHYPKVIYALIKYPMKLLFMRPQRAALSLLAGVFSPTAYGEWIGPWFFDVWGLPRKKKLRSVGAFEAERIAQIADHIYGRLSHTETRAE